MTLPLRDLLAHAALAVAAVRSGRSLNEALARCPADARPGTQAIAFHALRWMGSADVVAKQLVRRAPPAPIDALLRVALALLWPEGDPPYPPHVLVDQAVAAARKAAPASAGFVNAVLRRFARETGAIVAAAVAADEPLARWNHPAWWLGRLRADWPDRWQAIAAASNARAPMTLRVNARRTTVAAYLDRLRRAGLDAVPGDGHAVRLVRPVPVAALPGFDDGDVSVQDASAQRAAAIVGAGLSPGARVLDACAAPGGKTAHLLEIADIELVAIDRDADRLARVDETLGRLGLAGARTQVADAGDPASWWDGRPFDAILLDAPCTASGIVRRHPDVRWLRRPGDVEALAATQGRLLDALFPLLAPAGRLLFATCSVFKAEGEQQIDAFLQRQPAAALVPGEASPGHLLPLPDNPEHSPHALPPVAGDGFFLASIEKMTTPPRGIPQRGTTAVP